MWIVHIRGKQRYYKCLQVVNMDNRVIKKVLKLEKPLAQGEKVYRELKQAILDGDIKRGTWIQEEQICKAFEASRTPVREAFSRLKGENILEIMPRKGARVVDMNALQLGDLYEARANIELFYFLKSANSFTREDYLHLKNELSEIEQKLLNTEEYSEEWEAYRKTFTRIDRNFHDRLILNCGNEYWVKFYWQIRDLIVISGNVRSFSSTSMRSVIKEHYEILEALIDERFEDARDLMSEHIINTYHHEEKNMRRQEMQQMTNNLTD